MSKKRSVVVLLLLALVTGLLAVSRQEWSSSAGVAQADRLEVSARPSGEEIPEHVTYDVLFRQIAVLKRKADELDRRTEGGDDLRKFVYREAKLDEAQAAKVDKIQTDYMDAVVKLDEKAKAIIGEARAQRPHGQLQAGEPLPEPPQELKALQERRNRLTLRARDSVREALGEEGFRNFGEFVKEHIARKLRPVEPIGGRPSNLGEKDQKEKARR